MDSKVLKNNDRENNERHENIIVCRCMEITKAQIIDSIRQGAYTIDAIKRATGACMGLCQSKTCFSIISNTISEETGIPVSEIFPIKIRVPIRPVRVESLDLEI